jgi:aryl-alcohol dehydrogenase-like predicted oxidoreductase
MKTKQLGNSDLFVAPLVLGGNVFGWTIDQETSFAILDAFTGSGFNLIDTADVYSKWVPGNAGGESETIIGNWMKVRGNRNRILIGTKVGGDMGAGKTLSKKYIIKAAEASLARLQTDCIDLYQSHFDDLSIPMDEILEAFEQLVKAGKVKWTGTSNISPARLAESLEVAKKKDYPVYQSLQPEYNLFDRQQYEKEYEQICIENHLGVICYYSLASGFLTGKYRSEKDLEKSVRGGGVKKYLNERGFRILHALDIVAARYHTTPASIALAWLIARPSVTAPIASATSIAQLKELTTAASLALSNEDVELLTEASAYAAVHG